MDRKEPNTMSKLDKVMLILAVLVVLGHLTIQTFEIRALNEQLEQCIKLIPQSIASTKVEVKSAARESSAKRKRRRSRLHAT